MADGARGTSKSSGHDDSSGRWHREDPVNDVGIAEARQGAPLRIGLVDAAFTQGAGGLSQVVLHLVDHVLDVDPPTDLPSKIGDVLVDQVGFGHGWAPFRTAEIASANSCH